MSQKNEQGEMFELECKRLLESLGFTDTHLTKRSGDQGGDLIGNYSGTLYVFQCKDHQKKQGNKAIRQVIAAKPIYRAARCGVISRSGFTKLCTELAQANYCLLIKHDQLEKSVESNETFTVFIDNYKFPATTIPLVSNELDIIKRYEKIKHDLGHVPRNSDLDPDLRHKIRSKYRNLTAFITAIGDRLYSAKPTKPEIKQEYIRIKKELGKTPTLQDIKQQSKLSRNCFSSYPFTELQIECGDAPNIKRGVSKEELIEAFHQLIRKLGRVPTIAELDEHGRYRCSYYRTRWGSYKDFLKAENIPQRIAVKRQYTDAELLMIYLLLSKAMGIRQDETRLLLNHTSLEKLRYDNAVFINPSTYSNRFGGWKGFLTELDKEKNSEISRQLDRSIAEFLTDSNDKG